MKVLMENISEYKIFLMNINKDLDDHYFATENCFDFRGDLQCKNNPGQESIQQQINQQELLQKKIYWQNSTHIHRSQNCIHYFPQEQLINYAQAHRHSSKEIKNSKQLQKVYEKYHFEYLRKKRKNQLWQLEMKNFLLSLKLSIKIAQKLETKRNYVADKERKIDFGFQFPQNQEITNNQKHQVLPDQCRIMKDSPMNSSGKSNGDQRYFQLRQRKLKEIRRIKKRQENSNEMKFSSQDVIENIKILRTQMLKLLKPQLGDGKLLENFEKENQSSSNQIFFIRKDLKMKPSYQTIRIVAQIYITEGYNYKIMEKIKYMDRDLKNIPKHQRQQQLRFKSISNLSNRDYSNFCILIVRFSLRQVENLLIDFYKVQDLSRIKYYEFDLIRIMLLKFQEYFQEKLFTTWFQVIKLLFELENKVQIPKQKDLIDLYVEIMKKLKNQIYIKIQKGCQVLTNKRKFLTTRQVPLTIDDIIQYDSSLKGSSKKQNFIQTSKYPFQVFSQQKKQKNSKKSFLLDPGPQLEEIYEFTL